MSLHRCEPAPFYVLDEMDSALDWFFLERIMKLICEDTRSQYLITSFKPQLVDVLGDSCHYYLVENRDRDSSIKRVDQQAAKQALETISN